MMINVIWNVAPTKQTLFIADIQTQNVCRDQVLLLHLITL